jgi:uncharacterized membrane protein
MYAKTNLYLYLFLLVILLDAEDFIMYFTENIKVFYGLGGINRLSIFKICGLFSKKSV